MTSEQREELIEFLCKNVDVFAWSTEDMSGIDPNVMVHRLSIDLEVKPVKQKKRTMDAERSRVASEEVAKQLSTVFIREVEYPGWLSNVVVVKKPNGKWCMCIDFTNLNKVCLNDNYPLPCIDQLVDATVGHELLSFMDAYSGYNQIKINDVA